MIATIGTNNNICQIYAQLLKMMPNVRNAIKITTVTTNKVIAFLLRSISILMLTASLYIDKTNGNRNGKSDTKTGYPFEIRIIYEITAINKPH